MADDTGDGVGTAPTRLVLVHDVEDPTRNLNPLATGEAARRSAESDGAKTEISEETARALIEGLHAPRVPTRVPQTATSNGEHVARFYGETLPLPAHVQPDVPATIIDVTDQLPIAPFETEPGLREETTTEPTRSLGHDTIPNAPLFQQRDDRRAPTVPSIRIAEESHGPVVTEVPSTKKRAIGIVSAIVLFFLFAFAVRTFLETRAPGVNRDQGTNSTPTITQVSETKSASSVVAAIDAAARSSAALSDVSPPTASPTAPKPSRAVQTTPAKSPRTLNPAPGNDTPVPHSARGEREIQ